MLRQFYDKLEAHNLLKAAPYWLAATLTGLVAVAYARAIEEADALAKQLFGHSRYWLLLATPAAFIVARWLVQRFGPAAAGSGIPQVMAAIEFEEEHRKVGLKRLFGKRVLATKVASSLMCVLGGGAVGREGPMIQIAASIFHEVGLRFRGVYRTANHQSWLIAGGSAGIAAAFNTPLGGVVFAIEELATPHFNKFKTTVVSGVIVAGMVAQAILGPYLYLGPATIEPTTPAAMGFAAIVAVLAGIAGGLFGKLLWSVTAFLRTRSDLFRLGVAAAFGLAVAAIAIVVGPEVMGGGADWVRELLFHKSPEQHPLLVFCGRFAATALSFLSGVAGGIFGPSLAIGASLGGAFAHLLPQAPENLMIVVGMTGFLAAVTRAPFTAFILVLEMTDRHSAIFPMMLAAIAAIAVARRIDHESFYERQKRVFLDQLAPRSKQEAV